MPVQCRVAPSIGKLEGSHQDVWGTVDYTDTKAPCVFFGMYGLNDFYTLWRHTGKKWILWAGSDIRHLLGGYWIDDRGKLRQDTRPLALWLQKNCENWVENYAEQEALATVGIKAKVALSFMGRVKDFPVTYHWSNYPKVYASVSGDNFELYRWPEIEKVAKQYPEVTFYLYGNTKPWHSRRKNIFVRGRVSKEVMNEEIKDMQATIRLLPLEGASELVVKAALMGQYICSAITYPGTTHVLKIGKKPNMKARQWFLKRLNKYPWVTETKYVSND